jgi:hypothetical protein
LNHCFHLLSELERDQLHIIEPSEHFDSQFVDEAIRIFLENDMESGRELCYILVFTIDNSIRILKFMRAAAVLYWSFRSIRDDMNA